MSILIVVYVLVVNVYYLVVPHYVLSDNVIRNFDDLLVLLIYKDFVLYRNFNNLLNWDLYDLLNRNFHNLFNWFLY